MADVPNVALVCANGQNKPRNYGLRDTWVHTHVEVDLAPGVQALFRVERYTGGRLRSVVRLTRGDYRVVFDPKIAWVEVSTANSEADAVAKANLAFRLIKQALADGKPRDYVPVLRAPTGPWWPVQADIDGGGEDDADEGLLTFDAWCRSVDHSQFERLLAELQAAHDLSDEFKGARDEHGHTALHYVLRPLDPSAPERSDRSVALIVNRLLKLGFDVDARMPDGATPLMVALGSAHPQAASYLLSHGASTTIADDYGSLPIHCLANASRREFSPTEQVQLVRLVILLSRVVGVDALDGNGRTALLLACQKRNYIVLNLLVAFGAQQQIDTVTNWRDIDEIRKARERFKDLRLQAIRTCDASQKTIDSVIERVEEYGNEPLPEDVSSELSEALCGAGGRDGVFSRDGQVRKDNAKLDEIGAMVKLIDQVHNNVNVASERVVDDSPIAGISDTFAQEDQGRLASFDFVGVNPTTGKSITDHKIKVFLLVHHVVLCRAVDGELQLISTLPISPMLSAFSLPYGLFGDSDYPHALVLAYVPPRQAARPSFVYLASSTNASIELVALIKLARAGKLEVKCLPTPPPPPAIRPPSSSAFDSPKPTKSKGRRVEPIAPGSPEYMMKLKGLAMEMSKGSSDLDDLEIDEIVGRGGFCSVAKAVLRDVVVAVKYVRSDLTSSNRKDALNSLKREYEFLGTLSDTEGKWTILPVCFKDGKLVMEFAPVTLEDYVQTNDKSALSYWAMLVKAVSSLEATKIVHGDLKPSNVLVVPGGKIKLCDFGVSVATGSVALAASWPWAAPEVVRAEKLTTASDVFSLGMMLCECVTGTTPWKGLGDYEIMERLFAGEIPPLPEHADVTEQIRKIYDGCTKVHASERLSLNDIAQMMPSSRGDTQLIKHTPRQVDAWDNFFKPMVLLTTCTSCGNSFEKIYACEDSTCDVEYCIECLRENVEHYREEDADLSYILCVDHIEDMQDFS